MKGCCPTCGRPFTRSSLTPRLAEMLEFIESCFEEGYVAPSYDEMMCALNLSSKSAVHDMLRRLEERGYIERDYGKPRSLRLVEQ